MARLPPELQVVIAETLELSGHGAAARLVCRTWRAAVNATPPAEPDWHLGRIRSTKTRLLLCDEAYELLAPELLAGYDLDAYLDFVLVRRPGLTADAVVRYNWWCLRVCLEAPSAAAWVGRLTRRYRILIDGDLTRFLFRIACLGGTAERLRGVAALCGVTPRTYWTLHLHRLAFSNTCCTATPGAVRWLVGFAGITRQRVHDVPELLKMVCMHGRLATAQWLAEAFGISAAEVSFGDDRILRVAIARGNLAVVQWLIARFGLRAANVGARNWAGLRAACFGGHLATVQWLVRVYGITGEHFYEPPDVNVSYQPSPEAAAVEETFAWLRAELGLSEATLNMYRM